MKKIGDLLQGQVPPNQRQSPESDEKAAIKQYHIARAKAKADDCSASSTADLVARAMAVGARAAALEKEKASKTVVQLPLWPDAVRAVPNGFLRSALFGAIAKGRRRYLDGDLIAAVDGIEIRYTGQRLDQGDLDVYEGILHVGRQQALGSKCHVTSYTLLKLMGKTDTGGNRAVLHKRITRLRAGAVEVRQGHYCYIGGLIDEAYKDEITQEWVIVLNPKLAALFAPDQFTMVDWSARLALKGHQLAQWLHGFYASHAKPYSMKVETLHRLCGSENKELKGFRRDLREALNALAAVAGWTWHIDDSDIIHIEKTPTPSQARHLIRQRGRPKSQDRHGIAHTEYRHSTHGIPS